MKLKIYSILDTVAQVFSQPYFAINDGMALRAFQHSANDENSNICVHPEQFILHCIGEFDDKTAETTSITPKSLGLAIEFKNPSNNNDASDVDYSERLDKLATSMSNIEQKMDAKISNVNENITTLAKTMTLQAESLGLLHKDMVTIQNDLIQ